MKLKDIQFYVNIYIYIHIYDHIYDHRINFRPTHFSSYGNLNASFETTFRHLSFFKVHLDVFQYPNIYIQGMLSVNFNSFDL